MVGKYCIVAGHTSDYNDVTTTHLENTYRAPRPKAEAELGEVVMSRDNRGRRWSEDRGPPRKAGAGPAGAAGGLSPNGGSHRRNTIADTRPHRRRRSNASNGSVDSRWVWRGSEGLLHCQDLVRLTSILILDIMSCTMSKSRRKKKLHLKCKCSLVFLIKQTKLIRSIKVR